MSLTGRDQQIIHTLIVHLHYGHLQTLGCMRSEVDKPWLHSITTTIKPLCWDLEIEPSYSLVLRPIPARKFSLVQIFAEKRPGSSEEIFAVFIFAECGLLWPHPYRLMRHLRSVSCGFVGILYSRRLILLYNSHLEGRQTVENHHVHIGTRRTHVMTSSISILVHFFAVFIFAETGLSAKIAKNLHPAKISRYTVDWK